MNRLLLLRENTYICGIHFKISGVVVVDKNHITDCGKSLLLNSQRISKTDRIRMSFYIYHTAANVDFTLSYKKKKMNISVGVPRMILYYYTIGSCSALFIIWETYKNVVSELILF